MKQLYNNVLLWSVILVMFVGFYQFFNAHPAPASEVPYSELIADARAGQIVSVLFRGQSYEARLSDGRELEATGPAVPPDDLLRQLDEHKATYGFVPWPPPWNQLGFAILLSAVLVLNALILVELRRRPRG